MPNIQVNLFKPHQIQNDILNALQNPDIFFVIAVLGRQTGKSLLLQNYAMWYALNYPGSRVLIVGPVDSLIQKLFSEIKSSVRHSPIIRTSKASKGQTEIVFINESRIIFRSAASEDNLRGESVDVLILDEAAFIKQDTFETILLPFLNVRGKKCLLASTPRGKNYLHDYYLRGLGGNPKYKSFRCSSYENPFSNKELLDLFKNTLSPKRFQQEILADFVDSASLFNNLDDLLCLTPIDAPRPNEMYWAGIDIGLLNDRSVVSIINQEGNLVCQVVYDRVKTPQLVEHILSLNNKWKFKNILLEVNGQGLPIFQTLDAKLGNIEGFTTTYKSKQEIIDDLIYSFNMMDIKLINDTELRIELESFIFIQDEGQRIKYTAMSGAHDDRVLSLAIGRRCWKDGRQAGSYAYVSTKRLAQNYI
jgi:hypothetical protein